MVLRKGRKFNVASAKTMRYFAKDPHKGNTAGFRGQNCIRKDYSSGEIHTDNLAQEQKLVEQTVNDGGIETRDFTDTYGVSCLYSMNKKKRWLLPDILAENIADKEFHKDIKMGVLMVELTVTQRGHKSIGSSVPACTAVHSSKFEGESCRKPNDHYSYLTNLRFNKAMRNRRAELAERRRERAKTGRRIEVAEKEEKYRYMFTHEMEKKEPVHLVYEIIRPRPLHHYPWHLGKKRRRQPDRYTSTYNPIYMTNVRQRHTDVDKADWCSDNVHPVIEEIIDDTEDYTDSGDYLSSSDNRRNMCLESFIPKDVRTRVRSCKRMRVSIPHRQGNDDACEHEWEYSKSAATPRRKVYGKGAAIYVPNDDTMPELKEMVAIPSDISDAGTTDSGFQSDGQLTDHKDLSIEWIDLCYVSSESATPKLLVEQFGPRYTKGESIPRSFTIRLRAASHEGVPLSAVAVFSVKDTAAGATTLRVRVCSADLPIPDLQGVTEGAVAACCASPPVCLSLVIADLEAALSSYASSSQSRLETTVSKPKRLDIRLDTVQSMMGWKISFSTIERVKVQLEEEAERNKSPVTPVDRPVTKPTPDETCGICFESLAPSPDSETGTALQRCGHWFCVECWVQHVASRVRQNRTLIHCPAFECDSVIDNVTLLSLMPASLARYHLSRLHDDSIETHPHWKWCPNPKCRRLAKVEGANEDGMKKGGKKWKDDSQKMAGSGQGVAMVIPVPCECGTFWCSECLGEAHWPATCLQASMHAKQVEEIENITKRRDFIGTVQVKRCPRCRHAIEKNGGCPHMVCSKCDADFCWTCGKIWNDHYTEDDFKCPKGEQNLETMYLLVTSSGEVNSVAMDNRLLRRPAILLQRRHAAVKLVEKLYVRSKVKLSSLCDVADGAKCLASYPEDLPPSRLLWYHGNDLPQVIALLARANHIAVLAVEIRAVLEYMSVIVGTLPNGLKAQRRSWELLMSRLMFIAWRMEELLDGNTGRHIKEVWRSLNLLALHGKSCLIDVARKVPLLDQ